LVWHVVLVGILFVLAAIRLKLRESIMDVSWITTLSLLVISQLASSKVTLIGKNTFLSFDDVEATFSKLS